MCRGGEGLTPRAAELVVDILGQMARRLAEECDCDPAEVTIGPVDIGPDPSDQQ